MGRWTLAAEETEGTATVLRFVRTSRLFRFKDDVTVRIDEQADGCLITAVSRSRLGKGDLGQNRRNLRVLLNAVRMRLER